MIYKIVNSDGTFGRGYLSTDEDFQLLKDKCPTLKYIEISAAQEFEMNADPDRWIYKEGVPGLFLGHPCGVIENPVWSSINLNRAKAKKFSEIEEKYEYACSNYMVNIYKNYYANTSWLATWSKVLSLNHAVKNETLLEPLRVYSKKAGERQFRKDYMSDVRVSDMDRYKRILENAQFSILQPKKKSFMQQLMDASTVSAVENINVDFGITINEKDMNDLMKKVLNPFGG